MALKEFLILSQPPPGPRFARPEDKLRGRVEGRTALIQFDYSLEGGGPALRIARESTSRSGPEHLPIAAKAGAHCLIRRFAYRD